jgi:protein SCO1/2
MRPLLSTLALTCLCATAACQGGEMGTSGFNVRQEASSMQDRIGAEVDRSLEFTDDRGYPLKLAQFFPGDRPVILDLGYFGCPGLCGAVMNGMVEALQDLDLAPGKDYEILTVSIDPREDVELAKQKKAAYLVKFARVGADAGWHFCVGKPDAIKALTSTVGFNYFWAEHDNRFDHPPALIFLSKTGKVTRVLQGASFEAADVKRALIEASEGRLGTLLDRIVLSCLTFDPRKRTYAVTATTVMKIGGSLTVIALAAMITLMIRRERRRAAAAAASVSTPASA